MLLRVEAIAARTPLSLRDQAIRLIIAYLLNTDVLQPGRDREYADRDELSCKTPKCC